MMGWKYAFGSVTGTRHKKLDIPCQDSCDIRVMETIKGEPILVAVVSDGAGSAKCAEIGSRLACYCIMEGIKGFLENGGQVFNLNREAAEGLISDFQNQVADYAKMMGLTIQDYSCTLITAVIGLRNAVFFQVGDGAVVISKRGEDEYTPVFWPGKGEYENTTHFAVDHDTVVNYMKYGLVEGTIDNAALFTDGLERLALHFRSRSAFNPFFKPLFEYVRSKDNCQKELVESVLSFLGSRKVSDRTDDDRTLIIASRCDEYGSV